MEIARVRFVIVMVLLVSLVRGSLGSAIDWLGGKERGYRGFTELSLRMRCKYVSEAWQTVVEATSIF